MDWLVTPRVTSPSLACEKAPGATLAAEKEGELATTSLEFEFRLQFPCGCPLTELSDSRQSAQSENERECKQRLKTRAKSNDVITNVISANQFFASTFFRCRYSNSRDVVASSTFFSSPAARELARMLHLPGVPQLHVDRP